jgi:hypothetical protein
VRGTRKRRQRGSERETLRGSERGEGGKTMGKERGGEGVRGKDR